jgi:hypothetical protein
VTYEKEAVEATVGTLTGLVGVCNEIEVQSIPTDVEEMAGRISHASSGAAPRPTPTASSPPWPMTRHH